MRKTTIIGCASALLFAPAVAAAQELEAPTEWNPPDPATVQIPNMNVTPEFDSSGDAKYFYFHKEGVSYETAARDIRECISYTVPVESPRRIPGFATITPAPAVPRLRSRGSTYNPATNQFGVVGAVIGGMVSRGLERRRYQSIMRMCMGFKNYRRYPTSVAVHIALHEAGPMDSILIQAKVASGPTPNVKSVAP